MENIIKAEEIFEKALCLPSYGYSYLVADSEEELAESLRVEAIYLHSIGGAVIVSSAFIDRYPFIEGITELKGVTKLESDHLAIVFIEGETDDYVDGYGNTIRFEMFCNYQTGLPPVASKISITDGNDNISRGWGRLPDELKN